MQARLSALTVQVVPDAQMGEVGCRLHHLGSPGAVALEEATARTTAKADNPVHLRFRPCTIAANVNGLFLQCVQRGQLSRVSGEQPKETAYSVACVFNRLAAPGTHGRRNSFYHKSMSHQGNLRPCREVMHWCARPTWKFGLAQREVHQASNSASQL